MNIFNVPTMDSGLEWIKRGIWGTSKNYNFHIGDVLLFRTPSGYVAKATVASDTIENIVNLDGFTSKFSMMLKDIEIFDEPIPVELDLLRALGIKAFQIPLTFNEDAGKYMLKIL